MKSVRLSLLFAAVLATSCASEVIDEPPAPLPEEAPPEPTVESSQRFEVVGGALFQAVKIPLFGGGIESADQLPVVAHRPGVLRIYVRLFDRDRGHRTQAIFRYRTEDGSVRELTGVRTIRRDSVDDDTESCLDVALPAEVFHANLEFSVEVRDSDERLALEFPGEGGFAPLPADPLTEQLKVVLVPVQYEADGSSRMPDTSPQQLERLSEELRALYPVARVELSVREETLVWSNELAANGRGWDQLLYEILRMRETDGAEDDVYYYGAFSPAENLRTFCARGGCVLGLSELSRSIGDADRRASIGLGFSGDTTAETFTHEIGHAHGRYHAPCGGPAGVDRRFPYRDGGIGEAGWDVRTGEFVPGSGRDAAKDFMGYCAPAWVSDYTWEALYTRITGIARRVGTMRALPKARYQVVRVADGGTVRWLGERSARGVVSDETVRATLADGSTIELPRVELDHLPGDVLYIPEHLRGQKVRVPGVAGALTVP